MSEPTPEQQPPAAVPVALHLDVSAVVTHPDGTTDEDEGTDG